MSHDTLRRLVSDAYNTQSAGMTVGLPRVKVDASQLRALIAHYDSLIAERDTLRAEVERLKAQTRLPEELVERINGRLDDIAIIDRGTTHWEGCEQDHPRCRESALLRAIIAAVEQGGRSDE